ncbi:MAG: hypothetical protein J5J00_09565 [Deltaproteobacteria bacterium]|nr:hypothetical protein [Deltaproteobacteria bacterium]
MCRLGCAPVKPFLALLLLLSGCVGKFKHELGFNPGEPIRVAVLPAAQVDEKGQVMEPDNDYLIDNVALISARLKETPAAFVRNLVQNELTKSGLDLVSPAVVDANLSHSGYDDLKANPPYNLEKILNSDPKEICSRVLSCDAVVYTKITDWDRNYYGIQTVNSVGVEITIVSASDGRVLFRTTASDSESRGLTKGPTGISDVVLEPIRGLDNEIITDLARRTVSKMLAPLKVENRPEFLQSSPPAIYASAHDARGGTLSTSEPLIVVASATPKQDMFFSIGNIIENIPMVERDSGHYIGKYLPLSTDSFNDQPVYVAVTDQFGRVTKQKIGTGAISLIRN